MYQDFSFNRSISGSTEVLSDVQSFVQAVQIILLTRRGNFPFRPWLGMNIGKYLFDYIDDDTINAIRTELNYQITRYLPSISSLNIKIDRIEDINGQSGIGIIIQSYLDGSAFTVTMAVLQNKKTVYIIHEVY